MDINSSLVSNKYYKFNISLFICSECQTLVNAVDASQISRSRQRRR